MIVVTDTDRLASASQPACVNELPVLFLGNRRGTEVALKGAIIILAAVYIMSPELHLAAMSSLKTPIELLR